MKFFEADFQAEWPVPCGLIIAAENEEQAMEIAEKTVTHTNVRSIREIDVTEPRVMFYRSGNY